MDKYILLKDMPGAKAGTIFYHDKKDSPEGNGIHDFLKLAWDENGNCQNGIIANSIVLHISVIRNSEWFEKVKEIDPKMQKALQAVDAIQADLDTLKKMILS